MIHGPVPTGRTRWTLMDRCRRPTGVWTISQPPDSQHLIPNQDAGNSSLVTHTRGEQNATFPTIGGGQDNTPHTCGLEECQT